ncbi:ABC-type branched-subunit amino acid transport system substrate-binding protein [Saccharothrix tamanrassetensis]|uniref:ABC-type branched-subunit amino acid transport system substrate-binding protein n=1 Tax=Saccharothrix tamanrassetensis TaxID=1051531 RepID=A0A841CF21_9PSEU|nr:ABC transporter substrate-binding protein [Saccharothrix tamanrassetensis]MBB5955901.1 ABC-type branched-subunit amino acid transport system substrate-binding protein [Saccharothrix tamanrassetensis]
MSQEPVSAVALTHQAIRSRESEPARARELLCAALAEDREYEPAWRWLAEVVTDDAERRFCLERAYRLTTDPATDRALKALRRVEGRPPAEVGHLVEPPRPGATARPRTSRFGPRRWVAVGLAALVLSGAVGVWSASGGEGGEPVHVALVAGLTGPGAVNSAHVERSLRMRLDEVNDAGGVQGHPVELLVYDDADRPDKARGIAEEIVREGRVLFVVGHGTSDTALAAAPVYRAAGIPAITPTASSPRITDHNDWYFRSMFGNRTQSDFLAVYAARVLGARTAAIAYADDESGQSAHEGFVTSFGAFGTVTAELPISDASLDGTVDALTRQDPAAPIVLAADEAHGAEVVERLREAGVTAPILGTASMGTQAFHDTLLAAERERGRPGLFTADLFLGTPLAPDSLSGPALVWAKDFEQRYGERPLWPAATARQALNVGLHAMRTGGLDYGRNRTDDRRRIRDALLSLKDKKNSFPALLGPLYFNPTGSAQMSVSFVTSDGTRLVSAPVQLTIYEPPSDEALRKGLANGTVVAVADRYLTRRQVVATGINLNEVRDLDSRDGTYFVDFFLWLKYTGDHVASDVTFVNAVKPDLKLGTPLRDVTEDGHTYRLYRVADRFKNSFDFRSFPFDRQHLDVLLQNRTRTADQVVYVTDKEILNQSPEDYLRSGTNAEADINAIPNWQAESARFFQRTVGSSDALGDALATGAATGVYYSQYTAEVQVARDVVPFLVKNLLPLILLIGVTYLSLFFKANDGAAPVSMGVTAILSTAVLLNNVTSQLPSVSYTVALEWGYYAFIFLAATCVLIAMLRKRLVSKGHTDAERTLTRTARIAYPAYVLAIVLTYVVAFT